MRAPVTLVRLLLGSIALALGQIWANKGRSLLTTIGVVIGVASVTAVIAALTGLKTNVLRDFESFGANKIYVHAWRPTEGRHRHASWNTIRLMPEEFDGLLDRCPSVDSITRVGGDMSAVDYQARSTDARVLGIDPAWHEIENRSVTLGRPFSLIDESEARSVCLVTPKVRDKLRLDEDCVGQRVRIWNMSFVVVGVVDPPAEYAMLGAGQRGDEVLVPFGTYWKRRAGWIYAIVASKSPELSEEAQAELRFFLRRGRRLAPGDPDTFMVEAIQKYINEFKKIAVMITLIAGGIVGISLLVGGVGIMNIMLVSVSERTREIGLRKAVGARPSAILLQFLVEAVMLCLIGGLIGALIGQLLTSLLAAIPGAKLENAYIPVWAMAIAFGFCALVGVIFGMFPAIKASQLDPIEALRNE